MQKWPQPSGSIPLSRSAVIVAGQKCRTIAEIGASDGAGTMLGEEKKSPFQKQRRPDCFSERLYCTKT